VSEAILKECISAYVAFRKRRCDARWQGLIEPPWLEYREARALIPAEPHVGTAGREWNTDYGRRWVE
jgi:hypothetical protein